MTYTHRQFIADLCRSRESAKGIAPGSVAPFNYAPIAPDADRVLLFSPHPDDECITGGLPFRLRHQCGMQVINVAVTQGSRKDRQQGRWEELQAACDYLGFDLQQTVPNGLSGINEAGRAGDPENWAHAVEIVEDLLREYEPMCIFYPHGADWNSTHIGTHLLVTDALKRIGAEMDLYLVETEFWAQISAPNLLVESASEDVARLVAATSLHVDEVARNPYHLSLPAWMQDNVRRGAEVVGGQGGDSPTFMFGTIYRISRWEDGAVRPHSLVDGVVGAAASADTIFKES